MISELMPRGYDNMFFALFGITNRAVSRMSLALYFLQFTNLLVFNHRSQRHSSHHKQYPQQLDGLPIFVRHLCRGNDRYLLCRHQKGS